MPPPAGPPPIRGACPRPVRSPPIPGRMAPSSGCSPVEGRNDNPPLPTRQGGPEPKREPRIPRVRVRPAPYCSCPSPSPHLTPSRHLPLRPHHDDPGEGGVVPEILVRRVLLRAATLDLLTTAPRTGGVALQWATDRRRPAPPPRSRSWRSTGTDWCGDRARGPRWQAGGWSGVGTATPTNPPASASYSTSPRRNFGDRRGSDTVAAEELGGTRVYGAGHRR